jgi:hypothetical protein
MRPAPGEVRFDRILVNGFVQAIFFDIDKGILLVDHFEFFDIALANKFSVLLEVDRLPVAVGHIEQVEPDEEQDNDAVNPIGIEVDAWLSWGILVFFHLALSGQVISFFEKQ